MPYAQLHYPFENKEFVEKNTPADWILEAQDQTRGWFRTLHVLSTGIFNKPAFKNVNSHGLILASDGRKMSKSKKNYTDPNILLEKFGADAVRNYLLDSTVLDLDGLSFKDQDLQTTFRETTLLLSNSNKYVEFVFSLHSPKNTVAFKHPLNRWWLIYTQNYIKQVETYMDSYQMQKAARLIIPYIRDFSTWYIRRSKDLLPIHGEEVASCLQKTMYLFATASLQPFNMERLWQVIKTDEQPESVHLTDYPLTMEITEKQQEVLNKMDELRQLVSDIHSSRKTGNVRVRQPLYADFNKFTWEDEYLDLLKKECNLLPADLSKTEGETFEKEGNFGYLKVDLVVDQSLAVLGYIRDFERGVQAFRKSQSYKPGEIISMQWQPINIENEELLGAVLQKLDWKKLCVDISWKEDLAEKTKKSFKVKELCEMSVL